MNRFAPRKRTRADMAADVAVFCATATWEAFQRKSIDDLTRMAGGDAMVAKYRHASREAKGR